VGLISQQIQKFLDVHKLGYVATVSSDNTPNLSPKGTIIGWDPNTLAFADIRSPDTMRNILSNPAVEINVIDPLSRKGFLFRGTSRIMRNGATYDGILKCYRDRGVKSPINAIVLVDVSEVKEVTSPLYDLGVTESEIRSKWKRHFQEM
jgi:predicted pyridoxine 5'-phosphate oxidase superfamily flavin-nucleotide-binding protein